MRFLLATNSQALTLVLGEVYRTISRHLIGKAGLTRTTGATGAVTLVQRFGSALNLNVHFHMVFLDGAYQTAGADAPLFHPVPAPESSDLLEAEPNGAARAGGFSLHAGVDIASHQREKLERLCRYVSRPPVASERLALTASGQVRYTLKTPYRDGTTHIVLEPLDLMARLAALVPTPRMHLTRYHGVFAPHSQYRAAVTPAHRGRGAATPRHVAMSWA